jgi:gas vesicle protein
MGETVEAIGYKTDVKSRAGDYISDKKDAVVSRVTGAVPDTEGVKHGARQAVGIAQSNPIGLAIGAAAVGFVAGLALPTTQMEDEKLGDIADEVKSRASEVGSEALDRGKQVAQEATQAAKDAASEKGKEQGQELASSLRDAASEVSSSATSGGAA